MNSTSCNTSIHSNAPIRGRILDTRSPWITGAFPNPFANLQGGFKDTKLEASAMWGTSPIRNDVAIAMQNTDR